MQDTHFDVAILGSGITGTILASILAKNGVRTLLVEQTSHPRFAIGESTVPETTFFFRVLAERYGVPEIAHLSTFNGVRRNVTTTCGVKRNFTFAFHRRGERLRPRETDQMATLSPPLGPDVHLFRQDVDAHLLSVAASYGAAVRQRTDISDVSFGAAGVRLGSRQGATFEAQYVVDAGGIKSPIAQMLGLRVEPPPLRTHSRALYTHMHGVAPFDACIESREHHGLPSPLSQGTLHHFFEGGWMWVIPFYNHPSSTNRLCSVGLNLDPRVHPPRGLVPEDEFRTFVGRYPSIAKQFERAEAIREWSSSDRLQFWSSRVVGDRFCLMPHAFAFVDPLFSSGLAVSLSAINMLAWRLIRAKRNGDYSTERFADVDRRVKKNFEYFDRLVSRSYVAFSSFDVWNAWYKVFILGSVLGSSGLLEALGAYRRSGSASAFDLCEAVPYCGVQASELPEYAALFDAASRPLDAYGEGSLSANSAADAILDAVRGSGLWPKPFGDPGARHAGVFTIARMLPTIAWIKRTGPDCLRQNYFNRFQLGDVLALGVKDWMTEVGYAGGLLAGLGRDFVAGYNRDWNRFA